MTLSIITINRNNAAGLNGDIRGCSCNLLRHIFGFCEQSLSVMFCRSVIFARNAAFNTHTCMVYIMCRYKQILRLGMN